jgi:TfoX/Sxy family transcriptional regulator of competence genes
MAAAKRLMPKWTKSSPLLVELFNKVVAEVPDAAMRKMFGYPAAFVSGQMFCSLFQDSMMIRLSETDRTSFIEQYKSKLFEPIPGRPMREYVEVPESLINASSKLKAWLLKSVAYASALPPKVAKMKPFRA